MIHNPTTKSTNKRSEVAWCEKNNPPSSLVVDDIDEGSRSSDNIENVYDRIQNVNTTEAMMQ